MAFLIVETLINLYQIQLTDIFTCIFFIYIHITYLYEQMLREPGTKLQIMLQFIIIFI
jgi:hypothetical protein